MNARRLVAALLATGAAAAWWSALPATLAGDRREVPLPVHRSQILAGSGSVYVVEGRVTIPKGVEVTIQKDTKIVGKGAAATIVVEGQVEVHGVGDGGEVPFDGVTIELAPQFGEVVLDMVVIKGLSKGVVTPKDAAVSGRLFLMNTTFEGEATVSVTIQGCEMDLQRVMTAAPVHVKGVVPPGVTGRKAETKLNIYNCSSGTAAEGGLRGGIFVESVTDVTFRTNRLTGAKSVFRDCGALDFDACMVATPRLEITQTEAGRFGKTTIQKSDFKGTRIALFAPLAPGKPEKIRVDKCWFEGVTEEQQVRKVVFEDADDNAMCGVRADIAKINERPLALAGKPPK